MRVRVKICGMTSSEAVEAAVVAGADAVGFVFAESPRAVTADRAVQLARDVPVFVQRVAVFHRPQSKLAKDVLSRFSPDLVQSDFEDQERFPAPFRSRFLPVFRDREGEEQRLARYLAEHPRVRPVILFESEHSGSGRGVDPERARRLATDTRLLLAGGLTPDNIGDVIRRLRPYGVDVSSGVEKSPGAKDPAKIASFVAAVREAERSLGTVGEEPA